MEPLMKAQKHRPDHPIVLIVDALDECERYEDIDLLIDLFTDSSVMKLSQWKIFITSRLEIPNRRAFGKATAGSYHPVTLHELPEPVIEHDISSVLIIAACRPTVPLFIFATTMCRFIADVKFGNPDDQIQDVLAYGQTKTKSRLDSTYLPILNRLLVGMDADDRSKVIQRFKSIVGPIIMLETPLSTESLSRLLQVPRYQIDDHLMMLHSVLSIPTSSDLPVRMLHLSFKNFLTDMKNKEATDFWIDEKVTHADIASRALAFLDRELRQNMCNLPSWGTERSSIKVETINASLHPEVQYSCCYWVRHIQHAGDMLDDGGLVHKFFQTHFMHWLECLGFLGDAYGCIGHVKALQMLIDPRDGKELSLLLDDSLSFVLANASVIDATPIQLYSSLLVFAPMNSHLRKVYEKVIPDWIVLQPRVNVDWGQSLHTLECDACFISFSHDSKLVVSLDNSRHAVRIWDVDTGRCIWILECHDRSDVTMAIFSDDSTRVLSALSNGSFRVWSVRTGECIRFTKDHTEGVIHGFGSSISTFLASPVKVDIAKILKTGIYEFIRDFDLENDTARAAAFSPNAKLPGICRMVGESYYVFALNFSQDSAFFAYSGYPHTKVKIVRTNNGECVRELKHTKLIDSVVFPHDSVLLAASNGNDIWIWNFGAEKCVQVLTGHGSRIRHIAFSQDSTLLGSSSDDGTVRIWRIHTSHDHQISDQTEHLGEASCAAFSPDSALIATSNDTSLSIWDAMTGECKRAFTSAFVALSKDWRFALVRYLVKLSPPPRILRLDTGAPVQTLDVDIDRIKYAEFSPDSTLVLIATWRNNDENIESKIVIWLAETGQCVKVLAAGSGDMAAVFSPNGRLVATSTAHDISLWNTSHWCRTQNWQNMQNMQYETLNGCSRTKFSPDSTLLASSQRTMKVWHCGSGKCIFEINHQAGNRACSISNDSKFIAMHLRHGLLGYDEIQVWCMETSQRLYSIELRPAPYSYVVSAFEDNDWVRFTLDDLGLETSHGVIALSNFLPTQLNNARVLSSFCGYGISYDRTWITWNGNRLLRLPAQYQPRCSAVHLNTVMLGGVSGRVTILGFASPPPETVCKTPALVF
ncbi:unnamed protein product [Clonostachys byssicola]|uniref:Nephrocystin 3-like N-terminal domain-containing protein n=1 Tax=Clonostachys byssicola TaxID=160290 RepID=A0A9N9Y3B5_9HYPO|nr:unnamed protein product [Clonostachys byssicola]